MDVKMRELDIREREAAAREKLLQAQTVQTGVQASYSAMQAGVQVAQMPQIAPVADSLMMAAGYTKPQQADDPDFPTAEVVPPMPQQGMPSDVQANTSPAFPPVPQQAGQGMEGIETPTTTDNLQGA